MAIAFSSKEHSLYSALITVTVPSLAINFSALQKSAISLAVTVDAYGVALPVGILV